MNGTGGGTSGGTGGSAVGGTSGSAVGGTGGGDTSGDPGQGADVRELLIRAGKGDRDAFDRLYPLLAPAAYGLAHCMTGDAVRAEELSREALVDVWRTAPRFDPAHADALTWAVTRVHRSLVGLLRSGRDTEAVRTDVGPTLDAILGRLREIRADPRVRTDLKRLTPRQREAVVLAGLGGHACPAAAVDQAGPAATRRPVDLRDGLIRLRDWLPGR
ncbi:sigma factor [Streptomyces sp. NPDC088197]|uniref:sigma factor n=1 Tax=Streptomyces sp. NPDC088197 TaxID=3365840 RepID=UPI003801DCAE